MNGWYGCLVVVTACSHAGTTADDAGEADARVHVSPDAGRSGDARVDTGDHTKSEAGARDAEGDARLTTDAGDASPSGADGGAGDAGTCVNGAPSLTTAPATIDLSCLTTTFDDDFTAYDISSGPMDDGMHPNERWFNGTDQCCMSPSNGWPGVMYPTPGQTSGQPVNPYSILPGGGLQIRLQESNNEWFSGVMTSVDGNGDGFSQAYGYFEMETQLPPGTGTWPSFWMLSLPMGTAGGEIDVFEQLGCSPPLNPAVEKIFHFTLHDWAAGTTPAAYEAQVTPDLTAGYHRYGVLWNSTYMALYFDGALLFSSPTPASTICALSTAR